MHTSKVHTPEWLHPISHYKNDRISKTKCYPSFPLQFHQAGKTIHLLAIIWLWTR